MVVGVIVRSIVGCTLWEGWVVAGFVGWVLGLVLCVGCGVGLGDPEGMVDEMMEGYGVQLEIIVLMHPMVAEQVSKVQSFPSSQSKFTKEHPPTPQEPMVQRSLSSQPKLSCAMMHIPSEPQVSSPSHGISSTQSSSLVHVPTPPSL